MYAVGIKVLKNKLSHYVRLVEQGEVVLVTDRDRVVAELRPPGPATGPRVADAALANLIRDGLVTPPRTPGWQPGGVGDVPWAELEQELAKDRGDR
jgi:antitoxin (DNA-binding transcriptional repressor) of toxin-antitoxin stability system